MFKLSSWDVCGLAQFRSSQFIVEDMSQDIRDLSSCPDSATGLCGHGHTVPVLLWASVAPTHVKDRRAGLRRAGLLPALRSEHLKRSPGESVDRRHAS